MTDAKSPQHYQLTKFYLTLLQSLLSLVLLAMLTFSPLRPLIIRFISTLTSGNILSVSLFIIFLYLLETILFFPLSFYQGYTIEHRYDLSTQTKSAWLKEELKSFFLGGVLTCFMGIILFVVVQAVGQLWWLLFGSITFLLSIVLAHVAPVVLLPLFYKISPIANDGLATKISAFCKANGITVTGVYTFDLSKNTKKANAALTGLGKTKKIILGDTLLTTCSDEEILAVLAHEIGHLHKSHILKMIGLGAMLSFGSFYLVSLIVNGLIPYLSISSIASVEAFPIYLFFITAISFILTPVNNAITRTFEWEADAYAIAHAHPKDFVSALTKLATTNLADPNPHPLIVLWSYSHPPIQARIDNASVTKNTNKVL